MFPFYFLSCPETVCKAIKFSIMSGLKMSQENPKNIGRKEKYLLLSCVFLIGGRGKESSRQFAKSL